VWDISTGGLVWQGRGAVTRPASPDATIVVQGDTDGSVRTVALATGQIRSAARGHAGRMWAVTWSNDGTTFATTSSDRTVIVWDPRHLQPRATLHGHTGPVFAAAFTANNKRLYTAGPDSAI
jgi:WD40 repeat protein